MTNPEIMNVYFLIAGALCFLLGLVHSILGEYLIFRKKRNKAELILIKENRRLKERHLGIIWATWHLSSLFGWCIGGLLIKISQNQNLLNSEFITFAINIIIITMTASAALVLIGTKGKHPGWIVLLLIAALLLFGN